MAIKTVGSEKYVMEMKDEVCNYSQAIRLRELGLPQNTYYYYQAYNGSISPSLLCGNRFPEDEWTKHYGAYTVTEMALILPCFSFDKADMERTRAIEAAKGRTLITKDIYTCWYPSQKYYDLLSSCKVREIPHFSANTLVDCVAQMLIFYKEKGL